MRSEREIFESRLSGYLDMKWRDAYPVGFYENAETQLAWFVWQVARIDGVGETK